MNTVQVDHFFKAMSLFKRRKYQECIAICNEMLQRNNRDNAAWLLKCKALTKQSWVDDIEIQEEGVADLMMDENELSTAPRPGTSFARPSSKAGRPGSIAKIMRPSSNAGRPISGYARPGTNRPITGQSRGNLTTAMKGNRPGTMRAMTSGGRFIRLGTASLVSSNSEEFIDSTKLNPKSLVQKKAIAKAIVDYLLYVENNPRKALEIAAAGTQIAKFQDWWWKQRLGKCYLKVKIQQINIRQMGIIRDAERQFNSSLKNQPMINTHLELGKIAIKLDQPQKAIDAYEKGMDDFPNEATLKIGVARVHDLLNQTEEAYSIYKSVLQMDNNNIESIACVAFHHFYINQPELSLIYFKRLIQVGVNSAELWNNLGLCCFYASQYDMAISCFERAVSMANDSNIADIWYNIGQIAIAIGDLGMAYQSFKISISCDPNHIESFNNLGVLELRKSKIEQAKANFNQAIQLAGNTFEPLYNGALLSYKVGDFQESFNLVQQALKAQPESNDAKELLAALKQSFLKL